MSGEASVCPFVLNSETTMQEYIDSIKAKYQEIAGMNLGNRTPVANTLFAGLTIPVDIDEIMIGLAKKLPRHDEMYELHRLLGALLSQELTIDEKLNIIGNEYDIPIEENLRKDVSVMCNLSQGIEEKGIAIGRAEGEAKIKQIIYNMYNKGFTVEQIAAVTDEDIEEVKAVIGEKELELV